MMINSELVDVYAERAKQLAVVYLTRRDDIQLQQPVADMELDLLVMLLRNGQSTGRVFGIITQPILTMEALAPLLDLQPLPFPICIFGFAMDTETGLWRWGLRPDNESDTRLTLDKSDSSALLNNDAIEQIIQSVHRWYEERK